jgi:hypothetical protein
MKVHLFELSLQALLYYRDVWWIEYYLHTSYVRPKQSALDPNNVLNNNPVLKTLSDKDCDDIVPQTMLQSSARGCACKGLT